MLRTSSLACCFLKLSQSILAAFKLPSMKAGCAGGNSCLLPFAHQLHSPAPACPPLGWQRTVGLIPQRRCREGAPRLALAL